MLSESVGAVLMIGHFIVSIFNVQLGAPVIYTMPFETMEQCQFYGEQLPKDMQIDELRGRLLRPNQTICPF